MFGDRDMSVDSDMVSDDSNIMSESDMVSDHSDMVSDDTWCLVIVKHGV